MSERTVRQLPLPDGTTVHGVELEFDPIEEKWNVYKTADGITVRVKTTVLRMYQLVDDQGEPRVNPDGEPEILVLTTANVVSRKD